jgi:hypothetical protein
MTVTPVESGPQPYHLCFRLASESFLTTTAHRSPANQALDSLSDTRTPHAGIRMSEYKTTVTKTYKSFLASYRPAYSLIRVVIVREDAGPQYFFCTDPAASVREILEAFADRSMIEQDFHDVKEVWGAGQQQLLVISSDHSVWTRLCWEALRQRADDLL